MNLDITFCSNMNCKNMECDRNQNLYNKNKIFITKPFLSIAEFKDCEFWEVEDK